MPLVQSRSCLTKIRRQFISRIIGTQYERFIRNCQRKLCSSNWRRGKTIICSQQNLNSNTSWAWRRYERFWL